MRNHIQIRTVKVELLRTGPSHNQLLSPLTQYLGICDGAEAGIVNVPFEHEAFLRRLEAMRDMGAEAKDRSPVMRDMGVDIAKLLGAIPRLPGSLSGDASRPDTLVHLRLVLSASELALLPFELAKIPIGPAAWSEGWLSLQVRVPVVITRGTRDTSSLRVEWPWEPRILFVAGDPMADGIPFDAHKGALINSVSPYRKDWHEHKSNDGRRVDYGGLLTILKNASFDEVVKECAENRYTHIHLLAHGSEDPNVAEKSYGLKLHPRPGHDEVVSGERFANAFASLVDGSIHRPTVVTMATCDSGNTGSVQIPGASMAHILHQAGIPLVVASQFPLSMDGSEIMVSELYPGLLRGDNPLPLLQRIRTNLYGRLSTSSNDWASLVVYEALPSDLDEQLEGVRYWLSRRTLFNAHDRLYDRLLPKDDQKRLSAEDQETPSAEVLVGEVDQLANELLGEGHFHLKGRELYAESRMWLAEAEFFKWRRASQHQPSSHEGLLQCFRKLEESQQRYTDAVARIVQNASERLPLPSPLLHHVLVRKICLSAVLGVEVCEGSWEFAKAHAEMYLEETAAVDRQRAHASLAELWLLKLVATKAAGEPEAVRKAKEHAECKAIEHAEQLLRLAGSRDNFRVRVAGAQFYRYANWWTSDAFEHFATFFWPGTRSTIDKTWFELGVRHLAERIICILHGTKPSEGQVALQASTAQVVAAPEEFEAAALPAPERFLGEPAQAKPTSQTDAPSMEIEMLAAGHGDCLWIEYGRGSKRSRVLIDCGTDSTYDKVMRGRFAKARDFELFILSHIDDDHIGGGVPLLKEARSLGLRFGDVWFNGWKHISQFGYLGPEKGEQFSELLELLEENNLNWNQWRDHGAIMLAEDGTLPTCKLPGGMELTLLSPDDLKLKNLAKVWRKAIRKLGKVAGAGGFLGDDEPAARHTDSTDVEKLAEARFKPDAAAANGSSIAVLAEYEGKSVLLGADAHAPLLAASIYKLLYSRGKNPDKDRLRIDALKLPHHGSQNNLDKKLLDLLECKHYLVSTDGSTFHHPDRQAISRVIQFGSDRPRLHWPRLHFNYLTPETEVWKDAGLQQRYEYEAVYPEPGQEGLIVRI